MCNCFRMVYQGKVPYGQVDSLLPSDMKFFANDHRVFNHPVSISFCIPSFVLEWYFIYYITQHFLIIQWSYWSQNISMLYRVPNNYSPPPPFPPPPPESTKHDSWLKEIKVLHMIIYNSECSVLSIILELVMANLPVHICEASLCSQNTVSAFYVYSYTLNDPSLGTAFAHCCCTVDYSFDLCAAGTLYSSIPNEMALKSIT